MDTIMIEDLSGKNLFVGLALVLLLFSYEPMEQDIKEYYAVAKRMIKNHMTGTLGLVLNAFQNLMLHHILVPLFVCVLVLVAIVLE